MKNSKKYISALAVMMLAGGSFTPVVMAANEMQEESTINSSETEQKIIDITPQFKMMNPFEKPIEVGKNGVLDIQLKEIQGLDKLEGEYTFQVEDPTILSINEKKEWQALKSGKTKMMISYDYAESSMKRFKEKYPDAKLENKKDPMTLSIEVVAATGEETKPEAAIPDVKMELTGIDAVVSVQAEGQLKPEFVTNYPIDGLEGVMTYKTDKEEVLSIDKDGKWKALKEGKVVIDATYEYSQESMKKIQEKYPNDKNIESKITKKMEVEVQPDLQKLFKPEYDFSKMPKEVYVGDKGTFEIALKEAEGYTIVSQEVQFKDASPSILKVDEKGNWQAIAAGEVEVPFTATVKYSMVPTTRAVLKDTTEKEEDFQASHTVKVVTRPDIRGKVNEGGVASPQNKNLPQTGDTENYGLLILGTFLIGSSLYVLTQRKQEI